MISTILNRKVVNRLSGPLEFTSGFSPLDIPNLVLWLDGSDGGAITKDIGDKVRQWRDKSETNNHANQLTAIAQPTFVVGSQNGLSTLAFEGGELNGDFFNLTNTLTLSGAYTVFQVTKISGNSNFLIGGMENHLPITTTTAFAFYNYIDQGGSFAKVSASQTSDINRGTAIRTSSGVHSYFIEGVDDTFVSANDNRSIDFTFIGKRNIFSIEAIVAEIAIYDREVTAEERQFMDNYLTRWGT